MYGSPPGVCWAGGSVSSDFPMLASWRDLKNKNHAAIGWEHRDFHLYGFYGFNVHDGIRPRIRDYFQVHHTWLEYVRDDCIENDRLANARIYDSLFDGCNAFMSTRPAGSENGSSAMIVLDRVLARLEPMPNPNNPERRRPGSSAWVDGVLYSHGNFFKTYSNGPRFTIRNSIFLAQLSGPNKVSLSFPKVASCSNNVIVWLGSGPYPGTYPTHCFRVTTNHEEWKAAVRSWHARHPDVGVGQKPSSDQMGSVEIGRS